MTHYPPSCITTCFVGACERQQLTYNSLTIRMTRRLARLSENQFTKVMSTSHKCYQLSTNCRVKQLLAKKKNAPDQGWANFSTRGPQLTEVLEEEQMDRLFC